MRITQVTQEIANAKKLKIPAPGEYNIEPEKVKSFKIIKT